MDSEKKAWNEADRGLIAESLTGSRDALEELVLRHQAWIYNIAFRMVMDHDDAADICQEILIKAISNLSTFDPEKGAFRTWLYRITVNHVLSMKKKKFEQRINDFDTYVSLLEKMSDSRGEAHPEAQLLAGEIKIGCMMGMTLCLNRRERLVFILGSIFGISDEEGSEIMEISKVNFRKILSRARKQIYAYIGDVCGHADENNPCRCTGKVKPFLDYKMADPGNLRFNHPDKPTVRERLRNQCNAFVDLYYKPFFFFFRRQPFYEPPDMSRWLREILRHEQFREIFQL